MKKIVQSSLLIIFLLSCAIMPKKSSQDNEWALKKIMREDGFAGVKKYFEENSYTDTTKGWSKKRTVINVEKGEFSLNDLEKLHNEHSDLLKQCSLSEETKFLEKCIKTIEQEELFLTNAQFKEVPTVKNKYIKLLQEEMSIKEQKKQAQRADYQKWLIENEKNTQELRKRGCVILGWVTVLKKISSSQYLISHSVTENTGRCARFGSSTMGGGCIQPEVISREFQDKIKFNKGVNLKLNSMISLGKYGFKKSSSNLIQEDSKCRDLAMKTY